MARYCYICVIILLALLYPYKQYGQAYLYKQYTSDDGLINSNVYRICQDKFGAIWAGTENGISRFDGYTFKNYPPSSFEANGLMITCDDNNRIWLWNNYYFYFIEKGNINKYVLTSKDKPIGIIAMVADKYMRLWCVNKYHDAGVVSGHNYRPINRGTKFNHVYRYGDDILFATDDGIYKADSQGHLSIISEALPKTGFYSISEDHNHSLYFGTTGSIIKLRDGNTVSYPLKEKQPVLHIALYDSSRIWFSTTFPGLSVIVNNREENYSAKAGLSKVFINDLFSDRTGNIFIATYGKGLSIIDNTCVLKFFDLKEFQTNHIARIKEAPTGEILVAGYGNMISVSADNRVKVLPNSGSRPDDRVNSFLITGNNLWMASAYYVSCYDMQTHKARRNLSGAVAITEDNDGNILAGSYQEVYRFSNTTKEKLPYSSPVNGRTRYILKYGKTIWFATKDGVLQLNPDGSKKQYAQSNQLLNSSLALARDDAGSLWVGTQAGLIRIDTNDRQRIYTMQDGLADNVCISLEYKDSTLWIGTTRGLCSYKNGRIWQYDNIIPTEEVYTICKDKNKVLWMGTNEGLYKWDLKSGVELARPLNVIINTTISSSKADSFYLPYRNNSIAFTFSSPDFNNPNNIIYEYRLAELDETWKKTQQRSLQLFSLNPGTYTLEIRCRYNNKEQYSDITRVCIIVDTPFWQRAWFIISCIIIVATLIFLIVRARIIYVRKQERLKSINYRKLLLYKQQAANALINPHFIFNALNSIQHFINEANTLAANRYLSRFGNLIRGTMENSTKITISLNDEVNMLKLYLSLEALRLKDKLTYNVNISEDLNADKILIPSMLIQPYVENAVWHGIAAKKGPGHIDISIAKEQGSLLEVTITDDGIGIKHSVERKITSQKSRGMEITRQRLEVIEQLTGLKINMSITALNEATGEGTIVKLLIPITDSKGTNIT